MNSNFGNGETGASSSGSSSSATTGASKSANDSRSDLRSDSNGYTKNDLKSDTKSDARTSGGSAASRGASSETPHGVDIKKYLDDAKSMGKNLESQMSTRPYVVLGAVAGVSFVAGSLLGSRIGQLAVAIGLGYAATHFLGGADMKSLARKATSDF